MTYAILAAMFLTWIFIQGAGFDQQALAASVCNLGMVPGELTHLVFQAIEPHHEFGFRELRKCRSRDQKTGEEGRRERTKMEWSHGCEIAPNRRPRIRIAASKL